MSDMTLRATLSTMIDESVIIKSRGGINLEGRLHAITWTKTDEPTSLYLHPHEPSTNPILIPWHTVEFLARAGRPKIEEKPK